MTSAVSKLYSSVIEDVLAGVRDIFIDDGADDQVLMELKQLWLKKLMESKAIDNRPTIPDTVHLMRSISGHMVPAMAQHINLPSRNLVHQPTLVQYTPGGNVQTAGGIKLVPVSTNNDKTVTLLPQKTLALSLPPHMTQNNNFQNLMATRGILQTGATNATPIAFPTNLANQWLQPHTIQTVAVKDGSLQFQTLAGGKHLTLTPAQANALAQQQLAASSKYQHDGGGALSSEEEEEDDAFNNEEDDKDEDEVIDDQLEDADEEEEPLNSADDVSDEDPEEVFDLDNVVVCQFDKITRTRNRWKFQFKDGIMNLSGRDFVFQKAAGDAEW